MEKNNLLYQQEVADLAKRSASQFAPTTREYGDFLEERNARLSTLEEEPQDIKTKAVREKTKEATTSPTRGASFTSDKNIFETLSPFKPLRTKIGESALPKETDSPFIADLKKQRISDELYWSMDRTDAQYAEDKKKYEQEAKDLAQYGRPLNVDKTRLVSSISEGFQKETDKNYGVFNWIKDSWNSLQNGMDKTNLDSNRGELIYTILPKLKASEVQLSYVTELKAWDQSIIEAQSKVSANPTKENIDRVKTLENAKISSLHDFRSKDEETAKYVQDLYASGWLNDLNKAQAQLSKDYSNNQIALQDKLTENEQLQKSLNDNDAISSYYTKKAENAKFSYGDADSWLYKMPETLGSSFATWKTQAAALGSQAALYQVGRIAAQAAANTILAAETGGASLVYNLATVGSALASSGISLYSNYRQRERETQAEVYQNYKERLLKDAAAKGIDIEQAKYNAKFNMQNNLQTDKNGKKHEVTDDEALDFLLTTNLTSGDKKLDDLKFNAKKGLETLINTNMALSASDFAEEVIFNPFLSMAAKNAFKAARTIKNIDKAVVRSEALVNMTKQLPLTAARKIAETATAKQAMKGVENFVDLSLTKLPGVKTTVKAISDAAKPVAKAVTSLNGKTYTRYVSDIAKKGLQGIVLEGGEEGTQAEKGYEYQNGLYDNETKGLVGTMTNVLGGMFNGGRTALGLSVNPTLDKNEDYQQNVIAGAMMGGLFGGGIGGVKASVNLVKQIKANNIVQSITVDDMLSKESMVKARLWADKKVKGKEDNVITALELMKENVPEGLTTEDIDNEMERAKITMQYADSKLAKKIAKTAGITYGSDEYKTMVGLAMDSHDQLNSENDANKRISAAITAMGSIGKDVLDTKLTSISNATGLPTETLHTLNQFNTRQTALVELIGELKTRKDVIDKMNDDKNYPVSLNSEKVDEYINRLEGKLETISESRSNFINDLVKQIATTIPSTKLVNEKGKELRTGESLYEKIDVAGKKKEGKEIASGFTVEDISDMLHNISDQTGATGNEINHLYKLQALSNLSLEDANNRYNAYHGLFFTDRNATRATTFKKATKNMSTIEKRDFAAALMAKDEINHYTNNSIEDRQLLVDYFTKQNQERNQGIQPETEEVSPELLPISHTEDEILSIEELAQKQKNEKLSKLNDSISEVENSLTTLRNAPANTVKYLPKELRKEVSKHGYAKTVAKYESQLNDLKTKTDEENVEIPKVEPIETTPEKIEAIKIATDAANEVKSLYKELKTEVETKLATSNNVITDEERNAIYVKYSGAIKMAKARFDEASHAIQNEGYTVKSPVKKETPTIIDEDNNEDIQPSLPVEEVAHIEEEQVEEEVNTDEFTSTLDKMVAESPEFKLLPVNKQRNEINRMRHRALKENPERKTEIKTYFDDLISKSIVSPQKEQELLTEPENALEEVSPVVKPTVEEITEPKVTAVPPTKQKSINELLKSESISVESIEEPIVEHTEPDPIEATIPIPSESEPVLIDEPVSKLPIPFGYNAKDFENAEELPDATLVEQGLNLLNEAEQSTEQLNDRIKANEVSNVDMEGNPGKIQDIMLWFDPQNNKPLTIAGYPKLKSGAALAEVYSDPSKLAELDSEIVVRDWNGKLVIGDESTYDSAGIYVIFTDKDGNQYGTALRTVEQVSRTLTTDKKEALTERLRELRSKIIRLSDQIKDKPNAILKPTKVSRNNGYFDNIIDNTGKPIYRPIHEVKGFGISSDYTQIDNGTVRLGIGRGIFYGHTIMDMFGDTLPGTGASGKIYIYPPLNNIPDGKSMVPIQLREKAFNSSTPDKNREVAELVYDVLIRNYNNNNFAYQININGELIDTPFTPYVLGRFLVNNSEKTVVPDTEFAKDYPFLADKQLYVDNKNNKVYYGNHVEPLSVLQNDPKLKEEFIQYIINNQHWAMDKQWLFNSMRENLAESKVSPAIFFNRTKLNKMVFIPGELEFDIEDFGLKQTALEVVEDEDNQGLSWIAWYTKNNKLQSDLSDQLFTSPIQYIEDVEITEKDSKTASVVSTAQEVKEIPEETVIEPIASTTNIEEPEKKAPSLNDLMAAFGDKADFGDTNNMPSMDDSYASEATGLDDFFGGMGLAPKVYVKPAKRVINTKKAVKWLNKKLGLDPNEIEITSTIIHANRAGLQVVGGMTKDSILLWEGAEKGVEYHEAFHRVSLLLLNKDQRDRLYDAYRKNNPSYKLTVKDIEENLADGFMDFNLNPLIKYGYEVTRAFKKFLKFIHVTKNYNPNQIYELYRQINSNKFANVPINKDSLNRFRALYGDMAMYHFNGRDYKTIPTMSAYYDIVNSLQAMLFSVNKVETIEDIDKIDANRLYQALQLEVKSPNRSEAQRMVISEVVEKFEDDFLPMVKSSMKQFAIKIIDKNKHTDAEQADADGTTNAVFSDKASYEVDRVANAQMAVKLFIAGTPKVKFAYSDKDGVLVKKLTAFAEPLTGLPMMDDYMTAFHTVLKYLNDCDTWEKLLSKTELLGKDNPFFQNLYTRLSNPKIVSKNLQKQMLITVCSNSHNMIYMKYGYSVSPIDNKTLQVNFTVGDSNVQRTSRQYSAQWSNAFYNSKMLHSTTEGTVSNEDELKAVCKEYNDLAKAYSTNFKANKVNELDVVDTKRKLVEILSNIGVNIDLEVLNDYLSQNNKTGTMDKAKELNHLLTSSYAGSLSYLFAWTDVSAKGIRKGLLQVVAEGKEKLTYKQDGRDREKRLTEVFKGEATINKFADSAARVHPRMDSMSVLGAEGNMLYPISQNCYASDQVRWLNQNTNGVVDKMSAVTYNKHSILLQTLRNKKSLSLNTFINFVEDSAGDRGRDYLSISDTEDFLSKMTLITNNHMIYPTMADKKMYFTISGYELDHQPLRFYRNDNNQMQIQFNQTVVNTMYGYMLDEIACIEQFYSDTVQDELKVHPEKKVKNYHTAEKGGRFRYFNRVYSINQDGTRTYTDLNDILNDKGEGDIQTRINKVKSILLGKADENGNYNRQHSDIVVNNMLRLRYMDDLNTAVKLGLIEKTADNSYKNKLLDQVRLSELIDIYSQDPVTSAFPEIYAIRSMIADYSAGSVISIMEFERLFSKDPAYYKNNDDKIKRVTAMLSTGDHIVTDDENEQFTVTEFKDNEIVESQIEQLRERFMQSNLRDLLIKNSRYDGKPITENNVDKLLELSEEERRTKLSDYDILKIKAIALAKDGTSAYDNNNVNQTDATVIIGPRMYKKIVEGLGEWSTEVAEAFEIMEGDGKFLSDPLLYQKSLSTLIKPLKTMYFGDHFDSTLGLDIPIFDKMAMFPLFKVLAKGDISSLYDRMSTPGKEIDMVAFSSAVKVGNRTASKFYTDDTNTSINDLTNLQTYRQSYRYLRRQLVTDPHHAERQLLGTQAAKAALSNLRMDRTYGEGENTLTGQQIRHEVMGSINALSNMGLNRFLDSVTSIDEGTGERVISNPLLSKMLVREAESAGMTDDIIAGLGLDMNGEFITPLSALSDAKWIESRFISLLNKEAVDIQLPGGAFIQRSSFGFKQITVLEDGKLDRGNYLNFRNDDGSMDCEISINLLAHVIPNYDKMSFEEARKYLLDNNIIGDNANPSSMGYRIPTQGLSSIVSLRIKEVMPAIVGDVIILPDSFTALTGSDFDIDKLYVARYNYETYEEDGIKKTRKVEFNDEVEGDNKFMENSREANENRLLDMYMMVLNDKKNAHETKASLDAPTTKLKEGALKAVREATKTINETPFYELSPTYQLNKKHEYTGGKSGIAPFALNNVHHVLTQLFSLDFATNKKGLYKGALNKYGIGNISGITGKDDLRILDWLSAMINAHVDVAKDPYIIELNVTQPTYNMTNLLLRSGLGEATFYFLPQPILKEYVSAIEKLNGRYGIDRTKSKFTLIRDAVQAIKDDYIQKATIVANGDEKKLGLLKQLSEVDPNNGLTKVGSDGVFDIDFLKRQLTALKNKDNNFNYYFNQLLVLNAYQELTPFAEELSELVHISQIDTKKFGNSFALQQRFMYRVKNMIATSSAFDRQDLINFFKDSFLDTKLRNSVLTGNALCKNLLITSTDEFNEQIESILSKTNHSKTKDETLIKNVSAAVEAFIKSKFFSQYAAENSENPYMDTYNLFYNNPQAGTLSMANWFAQIKSDMINGKYPEFIDKEGRIVNDFINYLQSETKTANDTWNIPDVIGRNVPIGTDKYLQNKLTNYWEELINSNQYPELSKFAKTLVYYAFIASGGNTKFNSIFHLIPPSYLKTIGYNSAMNDYLGELSSNEFNIDTDDIFKNNWYNGNIVPDIILDKGRSSLTRITAKTVIPGTNISYPIVIFNHKSNPIGMNKNGDLLFKPYAKVNLDRTKNPLTTLLYKYIGNYQYTTTRGGTSTNEEKPIYVLVNKKGISQEGVFIVEHDGYSNSAFAFNNIPDEVNFWSNDAENFGYVLDGSAISNKALMDIAANRNKNQLLGTLNKAKYIKDFDVQDDAYLKTYDDIMLGSRDLSIKEQLETIRQVDKDDESEGISMPIVDSEVKEEAQPIQNIIEGNGITYTIPNYRQVTLSINDIPVQNIIKLYLDEKEAVKNWVNEESTEAISNEAYQNLIDKMHPNLASYYEGSNITKKQASVLSEHLTLLNGLVEDYGFNNNNSELLADDILNYLIDNRAIVSSESPTKQTTSLFSDEEQGAIIPKYALYGINNTVSTNNDPINEKEVVYNNQTFIVTQNGKVYGKDGKEKYTSTDNSTVTSRNAILRKAGMLPALPIAITEDTNLIVTKDGIKKTTRTPNVINVNGRQIDIADYGINFKLNSDQLKAINKIDNWYNNSSEPNHVLVGAAGTGKTSITKVIIEMIQAQHPNQSIAAGAYTHSAAKNLAKLTGSKASTLHSLLGLRLNFDIDNFKISDLDFQKAADSVELGGGGLIIIDECSMVNEELTQALIDLAVNENSKILFIGDDKQLKPVNEDKEAMPFRFSDSQTSKLTIVERQTGANPLLKQLDTAREVQEDPSRLGVSFKTDYDSFGNGVVTVPYKNPNIITLIDHMVSLLTSDEGKNNPYIVRALAYRNITVDNLNAAIRRRMGYGVQLETGEPIKFYEGTGKFTNSSEAKISGVSDEHEVNLIDLLNKNSQIKFTSTKYKDGLKINVNDITVTDFDDDTYSDNYVTISDESQKEAIASILDEYHKSFVKLAAANPSNRGSIWRSYYQGIGSIATTYDLKLGSNTVKKATFKPAYASTVHKAQGATYTNVVVNQYDIDTARDIMDRKQLTYVAMSRPTKTAFVITNNDLEHENSINEYIEQQSKASEEFDSEAMNKCK